MVGLPCVQPSLPCCSSDSILSDLSACNAVRRTCQPWGRLQIRPVCTAASTDHTSPLQAFLACCRVQFAEERLQCMLQLHPSALRRHGKPDRQAKKRRRQVQVQPLDKSSIGDLDQASLLLQAEIQRLTTDRAMLLTRLEVCFRASCCRKSITRQYPVAFLCNLCSLQLTHLVDFKAVTPYDWAWNRAERG